MLTIRMFKDQDPASNVSCRHEVIFVVADGIV